MSVLNKFINSMKLNDDEDDDFADDDYLDEDETEIETSARRISKGSRTSTPEDEEPEERPARRSYQTKVTPIHQTQTRRTSNGMEVCGIKPTSFDDAREITETLLANRTVILNLEGLDVEVAQRILDFTSGSCFAISGNLQKISKYVFIITPSSVGVSGDFLDIFGEGGLDLPL